MTLRKMDRILGEFPWLWAIRNYWNIEHCDLKVLKRDVDNIQFREALGNFSKDSISVHAHMMDKTGYYVRNLHKLPFGPNGRLIPGDLFLSEGSELLHVVAVFARNKHEDGWFDNFTIFRIK